MLSTRIQTPVRQAGSFDVSGADAALVSQPMTILDQLDDLQKIASMIDEEVKTLASRVASVTRPMPERAQAPTSLTAVARTRSDVAERIVALDIYFRAIGGRIRDLSEQVDL